MSELSRVRAEAADNVAALVAERDKLREVNAELLRELERLAAYAEALEGECARLGNDAPSHERNVTVKKARATIAKARG